MKRIPSILLWMGVTIGVIFGMARLYLHLTDDFRFAHLTYPLPYHREWEIPPLSPQAAAHLQELLKQPFTYIGKGEQAYVFGSADGQYVIKFFKFKHLKTNPLLNLLPQIGPFKDYKEKQATRKVRKIYAFFEGNRVAYDQYKEESGLLFMHLNPTKNLYPSITLIDKMGWERILPLDNIPFVIQKRAQISDAVLSEALSKGDSATALKKMLALLDLYQTQYQKGILDNDDRTLYNTGFIEGQALQVDLGNLKISSQIKNPETWQKHLIRSAWTFLQWVDEHYPQARPALQPEMEAYLTAQVGSPVTLRKEEPPPRIRL
jgi:hypothetical protein